MKLNICRIPVVYKNKPLMPMKWHKCQRLLKEGKATLVKTKLGFYYLKLKFVPSGTNTQNIVLGIDPGSVYDSYSIVTKDFNIHFQTEFQTNRGKSNKIKERSKIRRMNRKLRRSRLRHRKMRFSNRNSFKLSRTNSSKLTRMKFVISSLLKYIPISKVTIEEVSFNHYMNNKGKSFSNVEIGKNYLRNYIINDLGLYYENSKIFYRTKDLRLKYFNNKDYKLQDKSKESFFTHSIDSYVIGLESLMNIKNEDISLRLKSRYRYLNKHTIFINQVPWINRRELYKFKKIQGNYNYFRYLPKGKIKVINHYSKLKKIRIKENNLTNSNHINNWRYSYQNASLSRDTFIKDKSNISTILSPTYKCKLQRYGGTIQIGHRAKYLGYSKYIDNDLKLYKHFYIRIF